MADIDAEELKAAVEAGTCSEYDIDLRSKGIARISQLDAYPKLRALNLGFNQIERIQGLEGLPDLRQVQLYNNELTSTEGLGACEKLEVLFLHNNRIEEISADFRKLKALQTLRLDNNRIARVPPLLGRCMQLASLDLSQNCVSDISRFPVLLRLQYLDLSCNSITDVRPLAPCVSLLELRLSSNSIENVKSLRNLKRLQTLSLNDNKISEWRAFPSLPALATLYLQGNALSSMQGFIVAASTKVSKAKSSPTPSASSKASARRNKKQREKEAAAAAATATQPDRQALFPRLDVLDLRDNAIRDIRAFEALGTTFCPDLSELSVQGNPVCEKINYESNVLKRVPQLVMLDGRSVASSVPDILSLDDSQGAGGTTGVLSAGTQAQRKPPSRPGSAARPPSGSGRPRRIPSPRGMPPRPGSSAGLRGNGPNGMALPRPPTSAGLRKLDAVDARMERLRDMMMATKAALSSGLDGLLTSNPLAGGKGGLPVSAKGEGGLVEQSQTSPADKNTSSDNQKRLVEQSRDVQPQGVARGPPSAPRSRAGLRRPSSAADADTGGGSRLLSDAMRFSRGNSAPHAPRSRISSGVGREDTKPSTKPVPSAKSRGREKKLQGKGIISKARARKAVDSAAAKLGSRAPAVAGSGATPKMQLSKLSLSKSAASPSRSAARDIIAAAASPRLSPSRRPGSPRSPGSPTSPAVQSKSETLEQEPSGTEGDGVEYDDINPFAGLAFQVRMRNVAVERRPQRPKTAPGVEGVVHTHPFSAVRARVRNQAKLLSELEEIDGEVHDAGEDMANQESPAEPVRRPRAAIYSELARERKKAARKSGKSSGTGFLARRAFAIPDKVRTAFNFEENGGPLL